MSILLPEQAKETKYSPTNKSIQKNVYSKILQNSSSVLSARTSKTYKPSPYEILTNKKLANKESIKIESVQNNNAELFDRNFDKNEHKEQKLSKNIYSSTNVLSSSIDLKGPNSYKSFVENNSNNITNETASSGHIRKSMENLNIYSSVKSSNSNPSNNRTGIKTEEIRSSILNQQKMQNLSKNDENNNSRDNSMGKSGNIYSNQTLKHNQNNYFSVNNSSTSAGIKNSVKSKLKNDNFNSNFNIQSPEKALSKNSLYASIRKESLRQEKSAEKDKKSEDSNNIRSSKFKFSFSQNENNASEFTFLKSFNNIHEKLKSSEKKQNGNISEELEEKEAIKKRENTRSMPASAKHSIPVIRKEFFLKNNEGGNHYDNYNKNNNNNNHNNNDETIVERTKDYFFKNETKQPQNLNYFNTFSYEKKDGSFSESKSNETDPMKDKWTKKNSKIVESVKINDLLNLSKKEGENNNDQNGNEEELDKIYERVKKMMEDHQKKENQWNLQKNFYIKQIDYLNKLVKDLMHPNN